MVSIFIIFFIFFLQMGL